LSDNDSHYLTSFVHGVCTLEITACETGDSGVFRCYATNPLGTDETSSIIHVEGKQIISIENFILMKNNFV